MGIKMKAQNTQNQQLLFIIIPFSLRNYYFIWASKIIKLILNTSWKRTLKAASVRHSYSLSVQHLLCPSWLRTQIWGVVLVLRPSASPVGIWLYPRALAQLYSQGTVYNTQSPRMAPRRWWLCGKWTTWADSHQHGGTWGCGDPGRSSCPWKATAQGRAWPAGGRWRKGWEKILILPLLLPTWICFKLQ